MSIHSHVVCFSLTYIETGRLFVSSFHQYSIVVSLNISGASIHACRHRGCHLVGYKGDYTICDTFVTPLRDVPLPPLLSRNGPISTPLVMTMHYKLSY